MKNLIFAVIIMLIIFACSDKNPVKNDDDGNVVVTDSSVTVTVTNPKEKTIIEFKDNTITIPAGAVEEETKITISYSNEELDFGESEFKTKTLKFESDAVITDTVYFTFKNPNVDIPTGMGMAKLPQGEKFYLIHPKYKGNEVTLPFFVKNSGNLKKQSFAITEWWLEYVASSIEIYQEVVLDVNIDLTSNEKVVVLVHGINSSPETWQEEGLTGKTFVQEMNIRYNNRVLLFQYPSGFCIETNAASLYEKIYNKVISKNPNIPIDIIGHSMGGVVSRTMSLNNPGVVRNLITLGSPHNGALMDYSLFLPDKDNIFNISEIANIGSKSIFYIVSSMYYPGGRDLLFNSPFIKELNSIGGSVSTRYLTLYGTDPDGGDPVPVNDGFILEQSANMLNSNFPSSRELPDALKKGGDNLVHKDLSNGSAPIFEFIDDFLAEQNQPPSKPQLLTPEDESTIYTETTNVFSWTESTDPDGDFITYEISAMKENGEMIFRVNTGNSTEFTSTGISVEDIGRNTWWVVATDSKGNETKSDTRVFILEEKSGPIYGTMTDIDGNVYKTVKIGDQWWMAKNLKVTHYRNGDAIPNITDNIEWGNLSTGAYCAFDNDGNNTDTYGLLYNWYALDDSRKIAPEGWHVPTDDEWKELEMYIGMSQNEADATYFRGTDEGGKLKESTLYWLSPNTGATNAFGFSALPGGYRYIYSQYPMQFGGKSKIASFWSSGDANGSIYTMSRYLYYNYSTIRRSLDEKRNGFSVRLIKNN